MYGLWGISGKGRNTHNRRTYIANDGGQGAGDQVFWVYIVKDGGQQMGDILYLATRDRRYRVYTVYDGEQSAASVELIIDDGGKGREA